MLTAACKPILSTLVNEFAAPSLSNLNQQVYTRLKLAVGWNLRGQIFVVVCDDGPLRHRLAAQLEADINHFSTTTPEAGQPQSRAGVETAPTSTFPTANGRAVKSNSSQPALVSLNLNLSSPNILPQVNQWLLHHPAERGQVLSCQILGIEQLTREPVQIQRAFLEHLQSLGKNRSTLSCNLVLWMSRPWRRLIQKSVPEFWQWHTAVFEFEGDPTPTITPPAPPERLESETRRTPRTEPTVHQPVTATVPALTPVVVSTARQRQPTITELELTDLVMASVRQAIGHLSAQGGRPQTATELDLTALDVNQPSMAPLQFLQQIEDLNRQTPSLAALAAAYHRLANWYRSQIEQGDASSQNLIITICAYEQVMRFLAPDSEQLPEILNDVGNLYWMLSRCQDINEPGQQYLEQAIAAYQQALDRLDADTPAQSHAMIQNNLGSAYGDLARQGDTPQNLQKSIQAYQAALQYQPTDQETDRYAATQNNLGTAYWNLAQYEQPIDHLQRAIDAYNEALRYYDPAEEPLHFAMIQNNLGTAYWNLAQCDAKATGQGDEQLDTRPEDFLQLAIGAYRVALIYRTQAIAPAAYAATQNNLGTAYWHLANQSSTSDDDYLDYLQLAIAAYREAISTTRYLTITGTSQAPVLNFDICATHNNLGLACYHFGSAAKADLDVAHRANYLEAALHHHIEAFNGWAHSPDLLPAVTSYMAQTVKAFYEYCGIKGQTQALSQIPPSLLPTIMKQL